MAALQSSFAVSLPGSATHSLPALLGCPFSLNHWAALSTNVWGKLTRDLNMHSSLFSQCWLRPGSVCSQAKSSIESQPRLALTNPCNRPISGQTWNFDKINDLIRLAQKEASSPRWLLEKQVWTHTSLTHTSILVHSKRADNLSFAARYKRELSSWKFPLQASIQMWEIPQKINAVTNCEG